MKLDKESSFGRALTFSAGLALFAAGLAALRRKSVEHPAVLKVLGAYLVITGAADMLDAAIPPAQTEEIEQDDAETACDEAAELKSDEC